MHTDTLLQAPFRSEAFAEDLEDTGPGPEVAAAGPLRAAGRTLLALLPAMVALLSGAVAVRLPPT